MTAICYTFAVLLLLQGIFSLLEGIRFFAFVRRARAQPPAPFAPKAAILAPCKGLDNELEENLRALFEQDYANYEVIFAVASPDDAARPVIERVRAAFPQHPSQLVIAPPSRDRSEKVNNLLAALDQVSVDTNALVFVDSDARVHPRWLSSLIAPLTDSKVGATTGYRWYVPKRGGLWSALLSAWNGSVATTLGDHGRNFAWGGSTATLVTSFDRARVRESWAGAVSDDYALTRAMQQAGLEVRFVPASLLPSREDASLASLLEFTTRQVTITRVYRPRIWWVGIISHSLFCTVFFSGLIRTLVAAWQGKALTAAIVMLSLIYLLGSLKGVLRLLAARAAVVGAGREIARLWWMFVLFWPLTSLLFLYNFCRSAMTRRIEWRGVVYEMLSPTKTIMRR